MMVAGYVPQNERVKHDRIHYIGTLNQKQLFALYKTSNYFLHLAWLDHCPNVVVDARACGCKIVCSSAGGTKEIAGSNAIVIQEDEWNFEPVQLYSPPLMNFNNKVSTGGDSQLDMSIVSNKYRDFILGV
jgi:glycosyltransferase involved in cell wall biosynthesis